MARRYLISGVVGRLGGGLLLRDLDDLAERFWIVGVRDDVELVLDGVGLAGARHLGRPVDDRALAVIDLDVVGAGGERERGAEHENADGHGGSYCAPGRGVVRYGKALSNCASSLSAPSVNGTWPAGATVWLSRKPIATRSSMSTTSSPGRRPLGKPARSQPGLDGVATPNTKHCAAPRLFWRPLGVIGSARLSRCISAVEPLALTPGTPVRNAATRSARGNRLGATTPAEPNRISRSSGSAGLVTYAANCASLRGSAALNASLAGRPMTTSLTSGIESREIWVSAPASNVGCSYDGSGPTMRSCLTLAVVQPAITSPRPLTQASGSSSAIVVMFLLAIVLGTSERLARSTPPATTAAGALTRSKIVPRLTA